MNSYIELFNAWGDRALDFAWPMLWQSSLLIMALFVLDFALRNRVRPATLHLLWMILLVKLVISPSLAVPFGAGWWLRPTAPGTENVIAQPRVIVTYGSHQAEQPAAAPVANLIIRHRLSVAAWGLLFASLTSAGLCSWMLFQWRRLRLEAQQSAEPPPWLVELLKDTRRSIRLRYPVRLKLSNHPSSPAVCGLWHPVILMPNPLVQHLTRKQLQGVILHELLHLRRGDVWTNCMQALLQIVYWWHPLLWIANARMRQVREEAVDEAVMLGLKGEAHIYAPTLLEVARMALPRPINALGLVGILESHGNLKRRIEKLLDFRAPQRARMGIAPILCILAFGAFAVPMGRAPAPAPEGALSQPDAEVLPADSPDASAARQVKLLYEAGKLDQARKAVTEARQIFPTNEVLYHYANLIREAMHVRTNSMVAASDLQTRIYRFDDDLLARLAADERVGSMDIPGELESPHAPHSALVFKFLKSIGLNHSPPRSWFFTEGERTLIVRSTLDELQRLDTAVQALKGLQILIRARFIEIPAAFAETLPALVTTLSPLPAVRLQSPLTGLLTPEQTSALLGVVKDNKDCKLLSESSITTLSGRQCQMQVVDVMTIVTNLNPKALQPPGITGKSEAKGELYIIANLFFGPTLDVVPSLINGTRNVQLSIKAHVEEFSGYADLSKRVTVYIDGTPRQERLPQPVLSRREAEANAIVPDAHSVLLSLHASHGVEPAPQPPGEKNRPVIVVITPSIVTATGENVHKQAEKQQ
jgi:beta-lactamase regulating signal transducer with metallopeptidase domain